MTWIIILSCLWVLLLVLVIANARTQLQYKETTATIIGSEEAHEDSDNPSAVTGYKIIVEFEVDGKTYSGVPRNCVARRQDKFETRIPILYNPDNPAQFEMKIGCTSGCGCLFIFFALIVYLIFNHFTSRP